MKRFYLPVVAAALALLAPTGWWLAKACAPDFLVAVFSYHRHPDLPRTEFVDGRLGVLQPTFARSYLVIAYRYLNGVGLDTGEREQARDYYKDRATNQWDKIGTDWATEWDDLRSRIKSPPAPPTRLITGGTLKYDPETHAFALNCADDAFRIATQTLNARRRQFGAASAAFRSWLEAQDKVFRNCEGGDPAIPAPAAGDLPALIQADRDYQIAAAHFYAGDNEAALDGFRRISQDTSSPWSTIARYLIARTLLRMTGDGKTSPALESETKSILANASLVSIHGMTWNLAQRAHIRERDQDYLRELGRLLSSQGQGNGLREEMWNFTDLYEKVIDGGDPAHLAEVDLIDWLYFFRARADPTIFAHSLERWQETRSPAWLLAALSHATAAKAKTGGLLTAALAIPANSPAYLTAQFHLQRIQQELGNRPGVRQAVHTLLASSLLRGLPSSSNLFRGLEMLAAPDLQEFLQFALRTPVMITVDTNVGEEPHYFADYLGPREHIDGPHLDRDATRVLNHDTPYRLLKATALGDSLPSQLRREALMTAFTRGLMLDQDLSEIATKLSLAQPDLADLATAYLRETTPDGRRFAAAFLLLQRPESRPYFGSGITRQTPPGKLDEYRDNWWCPVDIQMELEARNDAASTPNVLQNSTHDIAPAFLTGNASAEAQREFTKLSTMSAATDFLASIVFSYAAAHPDDPRIPEALHNLVRSGHYGCADVNTWKVTRKAFRMLHLRYPASDWTKRTPTWFKNDSDFRRDTPAK
jgi:hypothetical protein